MHFKAVKKVRKRSGFVVYLYFKDSAFRDAKFYTWYVKKGIIYQWKVYERGNFSVKNGI